MKKEQWIREGSRRRPVLFDCDVAVAGSGLSSSFAAIAAGRCGANAVLIERLPTLGGNIGPGMIIMGGMFNEADTTIPGGMRGIPGEFCRRLVALRSGPENNYPEEAGIASYLLAKMCREAGVKIMLSACASDPIMRGNTARGLFVECPGGRYAILAKVVIDGTGTAEIARRAGAPLVPYLELAPGQGADQRYKTAAAPAGMIRDAYMRREYPQYYDSTALLCLVANVDTKAYRRFLKKDACLSAADKKLVKKHFYHLPRAFWPGLCDAWRKDTLPLWKKYLPDITIGNQVLSIKDYGGIMGFPVTANGAINPADPVLMSRLEGELRQRAFEGVAFLKKYAGGCKDAYLLTASFFLGGRGGPHISAEHVLSVEKMFAPTRFNDVLYRNIHEHNHGGAKSGFDFPYRALVPKGIGGLLVCGRGAGYLRRGHDPTGMRARPSMMILGQAAGTAASFAARGRGGTRRPDIKKIQRRLLSDGVYLGESARLKELGLTGKEE